VPLAPSAAPGCPMGAAGTGAALGTASTPTHWQTGKAATMMPRLVTAPVASAAAVVHAAAAVRPPLIPLIQLRLEQEPLKRLPQQRVLYMPAKFVTIQS